MNQLDFWHADKDSGNVKDGLQIFIWAWFKMLSVNQIAGFLNRLHLKKTFMNQVDFWRVV